MSNDNAGRSSGSDAFYFLDISKQPCFRNSLLTAMLAGGFMGAHQFYKKKPVLRAADTAVMTFGAVAVLSWYRERQQKDRVIEFMNSQQSVVQDTDQERAEQLAYPETDCGCDEDKE